MSTAKASRGDRLVLTGVSWEEYLRILRAFEQRRVRCTYDRGVLEIMTLSFEHENEGYLLCRLVDVLTEEFDLPVQGGRSTTSKRRKHLKGLEPDGCWWIANEAKVRGKRRIDLRVDPPPDLVAEVDVTSSSINRLIAYAKLRVPEVWHYALSNLAFFVLRGDDYHPVAESPTFPGIGSADVQRYLESLKTEDQTTIIKRFRAWVKSKRAQP